MSPSAIPNDQQALKSAVNQFARSPLQFILQPKYRDLNKAQKMFYTLGALVQEVKKVMKDPKEVHEEALLQAFKNQKSVLGTLAKDFPQPDNLRAIKKAEQHLTEAFNIMKKLRKDVPQEKAASAKP